jgi:hypothetical protein
MEDVFLLGCSFTYNVNNTPIDIIKKVNKPIRITNLGYPSRSNFQILEDVKILPENCIGIIQWSALTRPNGMLEYEHDWNKDLNEELTKQDDPLRYLIENFINVVNESNQIIKEKNIKSFQYIGWQQWGNHEIDNDLSNKLKNLNINWFETPKLTDIIPSNCWHYQKESYVRKIINKFNTKKNWEWDETIWGGMSEWIRLNIEDENLRYVDLRSDGEIDSHPSKYATQFFYEKIIIPKINKFLNNDEI